MTKEEGQREGEDARRVMCSLAFEPWETSSSRFKPDKWEGVGWGGVGDKIEKEMKEGEEDSDVVP